MLIEIIILILFFIFFVVGYYIIIVLYSYAIKVGAVDSVPYNLIIFTDYPNPVCTSVFNINYIA